MSARTQARLTRGGGESAYRSRVRDGGIDQSNTMTAYEVSYERDTIETLVSTDGLLEAPRVPKGRISILLEHHVHVVAREVETRLQAAQLPLW